MNEMKTCFLYKTLKFLKAKQYKVRFWRDPVKGKMFTKKKFSIEDFFRKCDQIGRKLRIWSYLLKKFLMEIFFFSALSEAWPGLPQQSNTEDFATHR